MDPPVERPVENPVAARVAYALVHPLVRAPDEVVRVKDVELAAPTRRPLAEAGSERPFPAPRQSAEDNQHVAHYASVAKKGRPKFSAEGLPYGTEGDSNAFRHSSRPARPRLDESFSIGRICIIVMIPNSRWRIEIDSNPASAASVGGF